MTDFRALARTLSNAGIGVITFDNRGVGQTTAGEPFTLKTIADDIVAVWEHLGVWQSSVLGISMGGAIAQLLALHYPQLVARLILVSSFAEVRANSEQEQQWQDVGAATAELQSHVSPSFYAKNKQLMRIIAQQVADYRKGSRYRGQLQALKSFRSTKNILPSISCPTLVLHGELDKVVPIEMGEEMAKAIPRAEFIRFAHAGHMLLLEKYSELSAEIVRFLQDK